MRLPSIEEVTLTVEQYCISRYINFEVIPYVHYEAHMDATLMTLKAYVWGEKLDTNVSHPASAKDHVLQGLHLWKGPLWLKRLIHRWVPAPKFVDFSVSLFYAYPDFKGPRLADKHRAVRHFRVARLSDD